MKRIALSLKRTTLRDLSNAQILHVAGGCGPVHSPTALPIRQTKVAAVCAQGGPPDYVPAHVTSNCGGGGAPR